jgi:O-antigen ligase
MIAAPRLNLWLLGATVVLLPLLVPRGPGQSAPVDAVTAAYVVVAVAGLYHSGRPLRLPAKGPILIILVGSLAAAALALSLAQSMVSLLVEGYLLLLCVCVANDLEHDQDGLRVVLTVWTAAALGWAAVLIGLYYRLWPEWLLLTDAPDGARVGGATGNPNLAAGYLMTSFFILAASPWPRYRPARLAAAGWLLLGLYATGSNGALLGVAAGLPVLLVAFGLRRTPTPGERLGVVGTVLLAGGLLLGVVATVPGILRVDVSELRAAAGRERAGAFGMHLGRLDRSASGRLAIWSDAWEAAGTRMVVGVGPGSASAIQLRGRLLGRGLHNDYLAFLIERGVLGLLGLLALSATLLRWSGRLLKFGVPVGRGEWSLAGLGGAIVANLVLATSHESFHFRHVWILIGLTWVATQLVSGRPSPPADALEPDPAPEELAHAGH